MIEKYNCARKAPHCLSPCRPWPFPSNLIQRVVIDSTFQGFVTYFFTRLPRATPRLPDTTRRINCRDDIRARLPTDELCQDSGAIQRAAGADLEA
jgi:hypothetical protein